MKNPNITRRRFIGGAAATGVVTVVLTIIVATFALRMFARVFQFEEAGA